MPHPPDRDPHPLVRLVSKFVGYKDPKRISTTQNTIAESILTLVNASRTGSDVLAFQRARQDLERYQACLEDEVENSSRGESFFKYGSGVLGGTIGLLFSLHRHFPAMKSTGVTILLASVGFLITWAGIKAVRTYDPERIEMTPSRLTTILMMRINARIEERKDCIAKHFSAKSRKSPRLTPSASSV